MHAFPTAPHDPVLREVLSLVEERYLEPTRVDAMSMLAAARAAAGRQLDGSPPGGGDAMDHEVGGGLIPSLAPSLELVLDAVGPSDRARARGVLLDACLRQLDPFCRALTGEARRKSLARYTGRSAGIGIRIGRRDGRVVVLGRRPGSPADEAGLVPGDEIRAVDGKSVDGHVIACIVARLQGPPDTRVSVRVRHSPGLRSIRRRPQPVETVRGSVDAKGRVRLRIAHLAQRTPRELDRWLERTGAAAAPGLAIDLRGNTGGSVLAGAAVADRFVDSGVLLEALDRDGRPVPGLRTRVDASSSAIRVPLVVVVDRKTGSSAELLSAALAWHGRAELVGERTRGKNFVQSLHHWEHADLTLRLSAAYLHSAGRQLPASGLSPTPYDASDDPFGG